MLSDLISYGVLAGVFIVTGLRALLDKPNKLKTIPLPRWKPATIDEDANVSSDDT